MTSSDAACVRALEAKVEAQKGVVEVELRAIRQQIELLFRANDMAIEKARVELMARLEAANHSRRQLEDERVFYAKSADLVAMKERVTICAEFITRFDGVLLIVRFMGAAGVVALALTILRMLKVVP